MRRITITISEKGDIDVEENGKTCGGLCWDEMLGQIAMLTIPLARVGKGYSMKSPSEWDEYFGRPTQADPQLLIAGPVIQ